MRFMVFNYLIKIYLLNNLKYCRVQKDSGEPINLDIKNSL